MHLSSECLRHLRTLKIAYSALQLEEPEIDSIIELQRL